MKIGIVTFFCVPNYGAMLQAYALWHYLESRGHLIEFIDFSLSRMLPPSFFRCLLSRNRFALHNKLQMVFQRHILDFAMSFPRTRRFSSFNQLALECPKYDCLIVGSDQMWNPKWLTNDRLRFVMLDFAAPSCRRLACSVSFGIDSWPIDENAAVAGKFMQRFLAISVREDSGVEVVRKLSGRDDARCLIDPTLLYPKEFYAKLIKDSNNGSSESYIFEYFIDHSHEDQKWRNVVELVVAKLKIALVKADKIPVEGMASVFCKKAGIMSKRSVEDWISCISKAEFVCTNSFHGTVFSLLFHRPFVAVLLNGEMAGMNERIVSLLVKVGLGERAIYSSEVSKIADIVNLPVDWRKVDSILEEERRKYCMFLQSVGL